MRNGKRFLSGVAAAALLLGLAGCGGQGGGIDPASLVSEVKQNVTAGGREYGKTFSAAGNEELATSFFTFKINSAKLQAEAGDYAPAEDTDQFLVVNVTITNTSDETVPMYYNDFELKWTGMTEDYSPFPDSEEVAEGQLPAEYEIETAKSETGDLIFVVPASQKDYTLDYLEIYKDEFEGNTFQITFTAEEAA